MFFKGLFPAHEPISVISCPNIVSAFGKNQVKMYQRSTSAKSGAQLKVVDYRPANILMQNIALKMESLLPSASVWFN